MYTLQKWGIVTFLFKHLSQTTMTRDVQVAKSWHPPLIAPGKREKTGAKSWHPPLIAPGKREKLINKN